MTSNIIQTQYGELVDFVETLRQKTKVLATKPIGYTLAPQTNILRKADGTLIDLVESLLQGYEVALSSIPHYYTLSPKSDIIRALDGSNVSFIETLLHSSGNTSAERLKEFKKFLVAKVQTQPNTVDRSKIVSGRTITNQGQYTINADWSTCTVDVKPNTTYSLIKIIKVHDSGTHVFQNSSGSRVESLFQNVYTTFDWGIQYIINVPDDANITQMTFNVYNVNNPFSRVMFYEGEEPPKFYTERTPIGYNGDEIIQYFIDNGYLT